MHSEAYAIAGEMQVKFFRARCDNAPLGHLRRTGGARTDRASDDGQPRGSITTVKSRLSPGSISISPGFRVNSRLNPSGSAYPCHGSMQRKSPGALDQRARSVKRLQDRRTLGPAGPPYSPSELLTPNKMTASSLNSDSDNGSTLSRIGEAKTWGFKRPSFRRRMPGGSSFSKRRT